MTSSVRVGQSSSFFPTGAFLAVLVTLGCGSAVLKQDGGAAGGNGGMGGAAGRAGSGGQSGAGGAAGAGGATPCTDGVKDGSETDIDCGGTCAKCAVNKICAVDGDCGTGSCSHLFCSLVSGPPNWLAGPSLHDGRGLLTVALQPAGSYQMLLLAMGGRDDTDSLDPPVGGSYELLDTTNTPPLAWQAPALLPQGGGGPAATDGTGRILTFSDTATWSFTGATSWRMLSAVMPTPRTLAAAALGSNGLIYVVGGQSDSSGDDTGIIEAYDPVMNKWTTGLSPMPTPRDTLGLATGADGRLYAIGGAGPSGAVEAYSLGTNSWSTASALPSNAAGPGVVNGPDGRIYALGGGGPSGVLDTVNAYTPATNRWTPVTPLSIARFGIGAVVAPDGHLYAIGGTTNPELSGETTVEIYGPVATVTPSAGAPGSTAAVSGSNFAATAKVGVYFGSTTGTPVATGTTNAAGALAAPISFSVPNLAGGDQALILMDDRSQFPITLDFRVQ